MYGLETYLEETDQHDLNMGPIEKAFVEADNVNATMMANTLRSIALELPARSRSTLMLRT